MTMPGRRQFLGVDYGRPPSRGDPASTAFRTSLHSNSRRRSRRRTPATRPSAWPIRHLAHAVLHQQASNWTNPPALGDSLELGIGEVIQVSGSGGGLPKTPLLAAQVDKAGVVGDRQASRQHHGAPFQALCLFSAEVIDQFASQGHPVTYGSTGENVTVRDLNWVRLRAGVELQIGEVLCRLTAPAVPCSQNAPWFSDGDFTRLSHAKHPGHSRWYASVVTGGTIKAGDRVELA